MQEPWVVVLGSVLALLGVFATAVLVYIASQGRNRNETRRDTVADRDGLIDAFKEAVGLYRTETSELRIEVGGLRNSVKESTALVTEHTDWGNKATVVMAEHNLHDKIPRPAPPGVYIPERR